MRNIGVQELGRAGLANSFHQCKQLFQKHGHSCRVFIVNFNDTVFLFTIFIKIVKFYIDVSTQDHF